MIINSTPATSGTDEELKQHVNDTGNPHDVTAEQVGAIPVSQKSAAGGVATLGSDGKVPDGQLPAMNYDAKGAAATVQSELDTHKGDIGLHVTTAKQNKWDAHGGDVTNPHGVTKAQVGLGSVNNTTDANKPVSTAQKAAIDAVQTNLTTHGNNKNNPHGVTAAQTGAISTAQKGAAGGVAALGSDGKVPIDQLPAMSSGSGKKYATFVVGHVNSGHTLAEVDYLCTGTDDQVVINQAIQALSASGGKIIIRVGGYSIAGEILVNKDHVTLEGEGSGTVLSRGWNGSAMNGIVRVAANNCRLENLCFDGQGDRYVSSSNYNRGIYLNFGTNNTITGNTCNNNNIGIYLSTNATSSIIAGNTCNSNSLGGIYGIGTNTTITGNTCSNNNHGIYESSSGTRSNNTITGNTCINNTSSGMYLNSSGILSDNTITGNICDNNKTGINLFTTGSGTICSNTITGNICNNSSANGILASNNTANGTISSNTFAGNTCNNNNGIGVNGSNNTITGNTCNNCNNYGIQLSTASSNIITGNTCYRDSYTSSQHSIYLRSSATDNLVGLNIIMGKNVTDEGTKNTLVNNKY